MTVIRKCSSAVVLAVALSACAAKVPPAATFVPNEWAAVEALQPGTRVHVAYVTGEPNPLRHSFTGAVERVTPDLLVLRTDAGRQRLLSERVRRVSRIVPGGRAGARGVFFGAVVGAGIGAVLGALIPGEDYNRRDSIPIVSGVVALVGASLGSRLPADARHVIYERE